MIGPLVRLKPLMTTNNPDHYKYGTLVKLNADAIEQGLGQMGRIGRVVSRYPLYQIVCVEWPGKKSRDKFHIDLLDIFKKPKSKK